jgi:hypothetical protein
MHARKVSHKILDNVCAWMHAARRNAVTEVVLAAIDERRLSVTGLGRAIDSDAKEKNCIKRADRLIGNEHLYYEVRDVYCSFARLIVGMSKRPVILIDWSDLDPSQIHFLLRASVAVDGRSLSLYEEVHDLATKEKAKTHRTFLSRLKNLLPEACHPIVVSDAGFRTPWFTQVEQLGWDWVGRIRNRHMLRRNDKEEWFDSKQLYPAATSTPDYLGEWQMTRNTPIHCHLVLYKGTPKGRSMTTCKGERARSKHSEQCAKREREPWLLASSLPVSSKLSKSVVDLYRTRMQIEESFRDTKSVRFGIGFVLNLTRSAQRLQVLLLIAMIATFVLWLLGMAGRITGQDRHYQANTVTDRHVLSAIYLGLRVANDRRFRFTIDELGAVAQILWETVQSHGEGW